MTDKTMRELIEKETETFFEFPTDDRTHVTFVSCKLFAEHVLAKLAQTPQVQGNNTKPIKVVQKLLNEGDQLAAQNARLREKLEHFLFLEDGMDESTKPEVVAAARAVLIETPAASLEHVRMPILVAPVVQVEPVAYAVFADNGNIRIWSADPIQAETLRQEYGEALQPLYTAPQPAEKQPDVAPLVEALDCILSMDDKINIVDVMDPKAREMVEIARDALAAHRKKEPSHDNQ